MARIGLGLSDYWLIIRKRKWIAIVCFFGVLLSVILHTQLQTPIYRTYCSIRVIERMSVTDMLTELVSYTTYDRMESIPKILCGRLIIEKTAYKLGLAGENTPPEELENIIMSVQSAVQAWKVERTNIIEIAAVHKDPEMAAKISNTIAEVFIEVDMEERSEHTRKLRVFIEERLAESKQKLLQVENKLKAFKEGGGVGGVAIPIQNNIEELEAKKLELRKIYTEKYPDVIEINEQIENLKKRLQVLPESELEFARLTRELQITEKTYLLLQNKLEEAHIAEAEKAQDVRIVNPAPVPGTPVKPNKKVAAIMGLVIGLVVALFMSFVVETLDTSIGTIDDIESLLKLPVLAVIPYMKTSEGKKNGGVWQLIRRFQRGGKSERHDSIAQMRQQMLINYSPKSSTTESYRILRTNMKLEELLKNDKRILLITSTIPKEGKSITALNLSMALAQDGYKTLLIDCDLRKAALHKVFGIDKEPGLTDILLGSRRPEAAIRNFVDMMIADPGIIESTLKSPGLDNLDLLTCGKIVSNPAELLGSTATHALFSELKTKYNFLIIDSPPVLPVPDAVILSKRITDKLFLVYRAGYTAKMAILRAKEQLDMIKATPSGIILNSTTPESQIVSDYYHHYYHYRYYAEKEAEER